MNKKITLLIDGNNTLHRTHWVANNTGRLLINSKGENVGSTFTFIKTVKSYVEHFNAYNVYIAWDKKLTNETNFRNTLTEGSYKGTRDQDRNKDVYASAEGVVKLTETLGVRNIFPGKLEADDVISWLSKNIDGKKIIISVDRDFIQLVAEDISYYNPIKKQLIDVSNFEEEFNLTPKEYLYYKAIVGDTSDNIPGIEGYGKVKGVKLAKAYNNYKNKGVLELESTIKEHKEIINNNLKLMDLSYGLEQYSEEIDLYKQQIQKLKELKPDFITFKQICEDLEFPSITTRIKDWQAVFNKNINDDLLTGYFKGFE